MAKQNSKEVSGASLETLKSVLERKEIEFHGAISKAGRYSRYEQDPYNEYQNFLYNRALFGLSVYPKEEIDGMHYDKRKRIIKVHKRAQTLINLWKQKVIIELSNYFFTAIFPDSPITKELTESFSEPDEIHTNKMSFRSLGIKKEQVVELFIEEGILPRNFNEIKFNPELGTVPKKKQVPITV